ncbi:MAG: ornithine cyclodeaminase family protein [Gammaproteobacteria bacterium]
MQFINAEQVQAALDYPSLVSGLERLHKEEMPARQDMLMSEPAAPDSARRFFFRTAWQKHQMLGVKVTTIFPDNLTGGSKFPTVQAVYLLFDGKTGEPLMTIDGTALTWRKTAGDSALGAKFLAREDAEIMLMVGAGAMAPQLIMAHTAVRPSLRRVVVWNRTHTRAAALAESLRLAGIEVDATEDLENAVREADVVCCATATASPLLEGAWLKPGAHVDLVGGYTPHMREADDEVLRRGRLFVDCRDTTIRDVGDLTEPLNNGIIAEDDVLADHFQLCRGAHRGRQSNDEITVFKNGGGGHLDLMTARLVVEKQE